MKKLSSALLSLSLLGLPLVASAQPVVISNNHNVLIAVAKKTAKKVVKKSKSSTNSTKSAANSSKAAVTDTPSCTIKGNISATKEKIFHVIGCPNYGQTIIDTTKGERMFCSEQEAKDAGWRKSLNCPKS